MKFRVTRLFTTTSVALCLANSAGHATDAPESSVRKAVDAIWRADAKLASGAGAHPSAEMAGSGAGRI